MLFTRDAICLAAAGMFVVAGVTAWAQSPQSSQPQRTSATFDDWSERCEIHPGPPVQKLCEMVQFYQVQGQAGPLLQTAIGRASKTEPLKLVFGAPVNVWLPAG